MRRRISQLALMVAGLLMVTVFASPPPKHVPPPPAVQPSRSLPSTWAVLDQALRDQSRWYEAAASHPVVMSLPPKRVTRPPAPSGDVWWALALCESGGDPAKNTGNGFYGAFQFVLSTWRSLGYSGNPVDYSYETQREAAQSLQARSGWNQWPACARKLGLS